MSATKSRNSLTVISPYEGAPSGRYPMQDFASTGAFSMSCPQTETCPAVGEMKPAIIRMVVDLPAPLAPKKPSTSPGATENVRSSTASLSPYRLDRFLIVIMRAFEPKSSQEVPQILLYAAGRLALNCGGPKDYRPSFQSPLYFPSKYAERRAGLDGPPCGRSVPAAQTISCPIVPSARHRRSPDHGRHRRARCVRLAPQASWGAPWRAFSAPVSRPRRAYARCARPGRFPPAAVRVWYPRISAFPAWR